MRSLKIQNARKIIDEDLTCGGTTTMGLIFQQSICLWMAVNCLSLLIAKNTNKCKTSVLFGVLWKSVTNSIALVSYCYCYCLLLLLLLLLSILGPNIFQKPRHQSFTIVEWRKPEYNSSTRTNGIFFVFKCASFIFMVMVYEFISTVCRMNSIRCKVKLFTQ